MANNGLFDFSSGIQFQPDVQARYEAWKADPRNAAALTQAFQRAPGLKKQTSGYQAALDAGVLKPEDFTNAASNGSNVSVGPDGQVGLHEGVTKGMGPALVLGGGLVGGSLLAGGGGAAAAGQTPAEFAAGSTTVGGAGGAGAAGAAGAGGGGGFLDTIGRVAPIITGAAGGAANGRATEAQITNQFNNNQIGAANANLAQQKYLSSVPSTYASQAARGGLQANAQDASISGLPSYIHVPTLSGGLRPSALGPNSQAAGAQLSKQALQNLLNPQQYKPLELTPPPNASAGANALGYLGLAGSVAGAFGSGR